MYFTSSINENYEQHLLRVTLKELTDKEDRDRDRGSDYFPDPKLDRELHLAIKDMMEQLLAQADEDIRLVANTLFHFRNIEEKHYPIRCYEAIIALYKITFAKDILGQ
jgi:hypothetical protein